MTVWIRVSRCIRAIPNVIPCVHAVASACVSWIYKIARSHWYRIKHRKQSLCFISSYPCIYQYERQSRTRLNVNASVLDRPILIDTMHRTPSVQSTIFMQTHHLLGRALVFCMSQPRVNGIITRKATSWSKSISNRCLITTEVWIRVLLYRAPCDQLEHITIVLMIMCMVLRGASTVSQVHVARNFH